MIKNKEYNLVIMVPSGRGFAVNCLHHDIIHAMHIHSAEYLPKKNKSSYFNPMQIFAFLALIFTSTLAAPVINLPNHRGGKNSHIFKRVQYDAYAQEAP